MALAEYSHHRFQMRARPRYETHYAPRGPMTLHPGMRPDHLPELRGPQRSDRTVRGTSQGTPLLAVQSLRGADGIDDTAVKLFLQLALQKEKEDEEEERKGEEAEAKEALKAWKVRRNNNQRRVHGLDRHSHAETSRGEDVAGARDDIGGLDASKPGSSSASSSTRRKKKKRRKR